MLGAAGHPAVMTPTLDQLAANGVRYTNAYTAVPVCIAARRALMTGTTPRTHGDRCFNETLPMPDLPTLAETFSQAGYQTYAVGKLHVYPQRDRIGFDDVILNEEGRHHLGLQADDYELFLAAEGYAGQEFAHGMCNNDYMARPWHLPERLHATNWTVHEMCRMIKRRDPTRPAFWYMSFNFPHPPLVPLADYLDLYRAVDVPPAAQGTWSWEFDYLPYALRMRADRWPGLGDHELRLARRAYYALCTHIDHQIRLVIGLLREEGLLDDTIIAFTADHGDMLGDHGQFAKGMFYEGAANVPLILVPSAQYAHLRHHQLDDRLVELRDVMPTLLDMAGVPIPDTVEGLSLLSDVRRPHLYGEYEEENAATRMIRDQRYKLIYYPVGNRVHLFDLQEDPNEFMDLSADPDYAGVRQALTERLIEQLYGDDLNWIQDGELVGRPDKVYEPAPNHGLSGQRGWRFM
jgi:arylsulfatase A-like enzyme